MTLKKICSSISIHSDPMSIVMILPSLRAVIYKKSKKTLMKYLRIWRNKMKSSMIQSKKCLIYLPLLPSFSDVDEWKKKAIKKLTELDEDLSSFNGVGDETDVKEVMHQIETVMSNAKTSEGKARFADFEGASQGSELAKLQGYNADKKEEQMKKAKDIKESTIKDLNKTSSKDIVNKAYQEFKDGDLTYDQYTAIVNSVKNTSENMSEGKIKENATDDFIEYLEDRGMLEGYLEEHATVAEQVKAKEAKDGALQGQMESSSKVIV